VCATKLHRINLDGKFTIDGCPELSGEPGLKAFRQGDRHLQRAGSLHDNQPVNNSLCFTFAFYRAPYDFAPACCIDSDRWTLGVNDE